MPEKDPCELLKNTPGYDYCVNPDSAPGSPQDVPRDALTNGGADQVKKLAESLIKAIKGMLAPKDAWAPAKTDDALYVPFLWLGQHMAVAIFVCVVVVAGLTAWQGSPRLRQMGASTGWTLAAVVGMASVPGIVMLLHKAVSAAFTAAFDSNESTLFKVIEADLEKEAGDPVGVLIIVSALVVALAFAALVFMTRQPAILVFVCIAPLVLASLARGGDMDAVKRWAQRLLGLLFAPFALLLVTPFVSLAKGALVMDAVLLVAADALMLRMIFHGVPYFGPRIAGAVRAVVEQNTNSRLAHTAVRVGSPEVYEQENVPRPRHMVDTPGRAMGQDRGVLFAAYGARTKPRPGRLTVESAAAQVRENAGRTAALTQARREGRPPRPAAPVVGGQSGAQPTGPTTPPPASAPRPVPRPAPGQRPQPPQQP
ncbi:hypothetical protein [Streptomyces sp. NPDC013457]|uniref:hypothetical protein n=1 Tax=Streptomyces sp. NPDC013457 TaxID=3364866 RepID=UPI0036FDFFA4